MPISLSSFFKSGTRLSQKTTVRLLDNGLQVYVVEQRRAPIVTVQAWLKTGSIHEGRYLGFGLSHFLEHMIFHGTGKYPEHEITAEIHRLGGNMNAYTSPGQTVYYLDLPAPKLGPAIDVIADLLTAPVFPEKCFNDEKNIILRERDMNLDNPGVVLSEKLSRTMFQVHPVRHPILGHQDKLIQVNREMVMEYFRQRYSPCRTSLVLAGDLVPDRAFALIEKRLGHWQAGVLEEPALPTEPEQVCSRYAESSFRDPLARIAIGFHTPPASHPDVPALDVLAGILGSDSSSRLVERLQTRKGLALNIDAYSYNPYFCGIMGISALCRAERTARLQKEIFLEIEKIKSGPIGRDEIERFITQQVADYFRSLQTNRNLAQIVGNSIISYGSVEYAEQYLERLVSLTGRDIIRAANTYLTGENSTVIMLRPEIARPSGARRVAPLKNSVHPPALVRLDHGLRLVCRHNPDLPLMDLCLVLPGGTFREDKTNAGLTDQLAAMLTTGAAGFTEKQLATLLDKHAVKYTVSAGNNTLALRFNFLRDKFPLVLSVLRSILSGPVFSGKAFIREQQKRLAELHSRQTQPQYIAEERLCRRLYGRHPYHHSVKGTLASVSKLTPAQLKKFFSDICLDPGQAVFGLAGPLHGLAPAEALAELGAAVKWRSGAPAAPPPLPLFPVRTGEEIIRVPREQAFVLVGLPGCAVTSPDRFALDIMQGTFNGPTNGIIEAIREKAGLAYDAGAYSSQGIHPGFLAFYAATAPESAGKVGKMLLAEIRKLAETGIGRAEFNAVKAGLFHEIAESGLDQRNLIFNSALSEFYGNGFRAPWQEQNRIAALALADVNRTIKKYLDLSRVVSITATPT